MVDVTSDYRPQIEWLNKALLDLAQEQSVDGLLDLIVGRLAETEGVALARIWLIRPGDVCETCEMQAECPDQSCCLHLVASAGRSQVDVGEDWCGVSGCFRRFPLGVRKVGLIGATGEAIEVRDVTKDTKWIRRPEWARQEGLRGFAGQPLIFRGQTLGVLALFSRRRIGQVGFFRLRILADHAAAAIANRSAYREVERLKEQLRAENEYLKQEVLDSSSEILGGSPKIRRILEQIDRVAPTDAPVLILGESGTGKELVAQEIHRRSARAQKPLIKVNCASVPSELYESEFFGHAKGAFTGAVKERTGRFELAHEGTLLLDEVGEIPIELQSKLLRVLEGGQFEPVGAQRTQTVDVRILAATNRDLLQQVEEGRFRTDLFYRLNVYPIEIPPLRERRDDIPLLARHFLEQGATRMKCSKPELPQSYFDQLRDYDWPGNVRELKNVLERTIIDFRTGQLRMDLPAASEILPFSAADEGGRVVQDAELRSFELQNITNALEQCDWKIYGEDGAAALLGVPPTTLASRIQRMGIKKRG